MVGKRQLSVIKRLTIHAEPFYTKGMDVLPVNFKVLRFCGIWWERKSNYFIIQLLQFVYRYTIVLIIYHFTVCEIIELARIRDNIEDLTEGLFLTFTFIALCLKIGNLIIRKREIVSLLNGLRSELCTSKNSAEKDILDEYSTRAKRCTYLFMSISQMTGIALLVAPIFGASLSERPLPFKMYTPYSVSDLLPYLVTYLEQILAMSYGVWLNVSLDSLVYGFTIQTCGQIELLHYRLTEIFENVGALARKDIEQNRRSMIEKCVRHHLIIHDLVERIQSLFVWIVTILFFFSLVTLCTSIFRMSKTAILSVEFLSLSLYLGSMLFQIFFYCWYGNELELKSKGVGEAVYFANWSDASVKERKSLLILMTISHKGLNLSYYGIFALSLNTFTWILKTSYSAFNLLQQMSD